MKSSSCNLTHIWGVTVDQASWKLYSIGSKLTFKHWNRESIMDLCKPTTADMQMRECNLNKSFYEFAPITSIWLNWINLVVKGMTYEVTFQTKFGYCINRSVNLSHKNDLISCISMILQIIQSTHHVTTLFSRVCRLFNKTFEDCYKMTQSNVTMPQHSTVFWWQFAIQTVIERHTYIINNCNSLT